MLAVITWCRDWNVRTVVHHARRARNWTHLMHGLRARDVMITPDAPLIPYGFSSPTTFTEQLPTCPHGKMDPLPVNIIEMLTPHDALGRRRGTSLFIEGGSPEARAARRAAYYAGLTDEAVDEYVAHVRRCAGTVIAACDDALRLACRLTFFVHFDRAPTEREARAVGAVVRALTMSFRRVLTPSIEREKRVLHRAVRGTTGGMTRRWRDAGLSVDDVTVELAHNLFGMTIQWAHAIRAMAWSGRPPPTTESEAAECILDDPPARVASSRVRDGLVVHDLASRCAHARRPVTVGAASTSPHHPIGAEDDAHYVPFGVGARRCPGEWLTYRMMMALRVVDGRTAATADDATRPMEMGLNVCVP